MKTIKLRVEIYKARDGWRWRIRRSGRILADSGEAYTRRFDCQKAITRIADSFRRGLWDFGSKSL